MPSNRITGRARPSSLLQASLNDLQLVVDGLYAGYFLGQLGGLFLLLLLLHGSAQRDHALLHVHLQRAALHIRVAGQLPADVVIDRVIAGVLVLGQGCAEERQRKDRAHQYFKIHLYRPLYASQGNSRRLYSPASSSAPSLSPPARFSFQ